MNGSRRIFSNSEAYVYQRSTTCSTGFIDISIQHKKPQLTYLNRLRPLSESAGTTTSAFDTTAIIPPTLEHLSLPKQKTIHKQSAHEMEKCSAYH